MRVIATTYLGYLFWVPSGIICLLLLFQKTSFVLSLLVKGSRHGYDGESTYKIFQCNQRYPGVAC